MEQQPEIDPSTVSGQLRLAIQDSGKTLRSIGEASGVDSGVISALMTGERTPTLETVDKLASALGLRLGPAANDATLSSIRESLSLTPQRHAERKREDYMYAAWLDTVHAWSMRQYERREDNWPATRKLLIEWQQRGRDLQEWYLQRLRALYAQD